LLLRLEVRGGQARRAPARVPPRDPPAHAVGASEHRVRLLEARRAEQVPDPRGVHGAPVHPHLGDDRHREAEPRAELGQETHRPFAVSAEMEVVADVDLERADARVDHLADEVLGRGAREVEREALDHDDVDPRLLEQLEPLLQRGEELGRVLGVQHLARVRVEGVDDARAAQRGGARAHRVEDRAVAAVDPVEVPHRQHRTLDRLPQGRDPGDVPQCYAPRVRILSRRFLASYLCALAAITAGTLLALAIVDMLVDFDAIVEGGAAALAALVARAPERHLGEALPFASFAAAFLAAALPSRRGELLALCAAGIHPAPPTLPILSAALAVAAGSAWIPGAPEAERAAPSAGAWRCAGDRFFALAPGAASGAELALFEVDPRFRLRRSLHAAQVRASGPAWRLRGAR